MSELRVGTLVIVVRTSTALDGITGTIVGPLRWYFGRCACCGGVGVAHGFDVELSRPVMGAPRWSLPRQHLIPITPPDEALDDQLAVDVPTHEPLAA